ncbi:MAG: LysR family transcriptional regulator [Clostridia bacterium]
MSIDSFRVFATVYEQKSFSRAAELLHLSQPGVSLQIQNLENEFGGKLFHRSPKQVKPTEAGNLLYDRVKKMLVLYEDAKQEILMRQNTVKGRLVIGASFTIGEYVLPRVLAQYAQQYPLVEFEVMIANTGEIMNAVKENRIDVGLIEGEVEHGELSIDPFMDDELLLVCSPTHPLAGKKRMTPALLKDQNWIMRESGSGTRRYSDQLLERMELQPRRAYVFSSSQGVKEAVAADLGIALLSRWIVRKELENGELTPLPLGQYRVVRRFSIVLPSTVVLSKAMEMFCQLIRQAKSI